MPVDEITYIYTLSDPRTGEIRYVGKSNNPAERFYQHLSDARRKHTHRDYWIRSLGCLSLKPHIEVLDRVKESDWIFWEQYWICQLKAWGINLVNATIGGEGLSSPSESTRAKMRGRPGNKGMLGKHLSPEAKAKLSQTHKGKTPRLGSHLSAESKAKISAANKGRVKGPVSLETRAKIALARIGKGHTHSEASKLKMSISRTGTKRSMETRAKMSIAGKGKHLSEQTRAKIGAASRARGAGIRMNEQKYGRSYAVLYDDQNFLDRAPVSGSENM